MNYCDSRKQMEFPLKIFILLKIFPWMTWQVCHSIMINELLKSRMVVSTQTVTLKLYNSAITYTKPPQWSLQCNPYDLFHQFTIILNRWIIFTFLWTQPALPSTNSKSESLWVWSYLCLAFMAHSEVDVCKVVGSRTHYHSFLPIYQQPQVRRCREVLVECVFSPPPPPLSQLFGCPPQKSYIWRGKKIYYAGVFIYHIMERCNKKNLKYQSGCSSLSLKEYQI